MPFTGWRPVPFSELSGVNCVQFVSAGEEACSQRTRCTMVIEGQMALSDPS